MLRHAAALSTLLVTTLATAQDNSTTKDGSWVQDFAKAKQQAKAEKKDLLVDFTGSDWCSWCIKLENEVFSQDVFKAEAVKGFVLVKLDYPQDKSLVTDAIRAQNETLRDQYAIEGYPTILLTDAEGRPYAQTGYQKGGAEKYNEHLAELRKVGDTFRAAMTRADAGKGLDRAKALDEALSAVAAELIGRHYLAAMEEIVKLDADGKGGLKAKYEEQAKAAKAAAEERAAEMAVQKEAMALQESISAFMEAKEHDKALAKLDEVAKKPASKTQHQLALFFKGMVIMEAKEDAKAAIVELEAAKALDAESPIGKQITMILPQLRKAAEKKDGEKKDGGK